jgi:hypothetical protein
MCADTLEIWKRAVRDTVASWGLAPADVVLVSGGSSWADHVAILLFLDPELGFAGLELHLPCDFGDSAPRPRFDETRGACGARLNSLHRRFSSAVQRDTLRDLAAARARGAKFVVHPDGFLARNKVIARTANYAVVLCASSVLVVRSGTWHTWSHLGSKCQRRICLSPQGVRIP